MHPLAYARGSVTLAESTRLLPSRDRQGAVSSEIPKTFKNPRAGDESCESPVTTDNWRGRTWHGAVPPANNLFAGEEGPAVADGIIGVARKSGRDGKGDHGEAQAKCRFAVGAQTGVRGGALPRSARSLWAPLISLTLRTSYSTALRQ